MDDHPNSDGFSDLVDVTTWTAAYDVTHDRCQTYYLTGISEALAEVGGSVRTEPLHRMPRFVSLLRRIRNSYKLAALMERTGWLIDIAAGFLAGKRLPPSGRFCPIVGQYVFTFADGSFVRLAVDAHDAGDIYDPGLLDWCDVYAKSNYREDRAYPAQVVPIVNGNPIVPRYLSSLRALRLRKPEYDFCFVVRVWGGQDETAGVEHNLRLLEALNKVRCRKFLLAYLVTGDMAAQEERLRSQGIATTRAPMPLQRLWAIAAASRINVIRLGMHNCIPWRFSDLLAMGACVLLDQTPQTVWPVPLLPGKHFLDLGATTLPTGAVAAETDYERIPGLVDNLLANPVTARQVQVAAADYFDQHASPVALARGLLGQVAAARREKPERAVAQDIGR